MLLAIPPSEQVLIITGLYKLLGPAIATGQLEIYCDPTLTLTFTPKQIRSVIQKIEQASAR